MLACLPLDLAALAPISILLARVSPDMLGVFLLPLGLGAQAALLLSIIIALHVFSHPFFIVCSHVLY